MPGNTTTYSNWMVTAFDQLDSFDPTQWPSFRYCCYQREICPQTGREHIQGYVMFAKRVGLSFLKKLDGTAHFEPRRGTHDQAKDYCSKEDTRKPGCEPVEAGDPPKPGKRTDLHDVADAITAGSSIRDLCLNHTPAMIKYSKGAQFVKMMISPKRRWDMNVIVLFGPTGLGKSELADHLAPDAYRLPIASDKNTLWFDGYSGEEDVIIEEFEGYRCTYSFLKEFLDRYPLLVPTKGGHANFSARRVIMTSNTPPDLWYKWNDRRSYAPLERRITTLIEFTGLRTYLVRKGVDPLEEELGPVNRSSPPCSPGPCVEAPDSTHIASPEATMDIMDETTVPPFVRGTPIETITCLDCGFDYISDAETPECPKCAERKARAQAIKAKKPLKKKKKIFD